MDSLTVVMFVIGMYPIVFLVGGMGIYILVRQSGLLTEYEITTISGLRPSQIPEVATLALKSGWDVQSYHDERVALVNLICKRKRTRLL